MRVVIDTNLLISGLLWAGSPAQLVELALMRRIDLVISTTLLAEFEDVITRPKFVERLARMGTSAQELLELVRHAAQLIEVDKTESVIAADPDDDAVLACAIAGRADAIVSGDRHLLELAQYRAIPIVTASALLERLAE